MQGIRYISWGEGSGYGEAARRYMIGLQRAGVPVTWTPMVPGSGWGKGFGYEPYLGRAWDSPDLAPICNLPIPYDVVLVHLPPEYYPGWAQQEAGKRIVGYTVWETDKAPLHWPKLLNGVDRILVPIPWNRDVFRKSGVTVPIEVVPHSLDADGPAPEPWTLGVEPADFVFYSIGVWSRRKAVDLTLEAYSRTFTGDDNVVLVLKTSEKDLGLLRVPFTGYFPFQSRTAVERIRRRFPNPAKVCVVTEEVSAKQIRALHQRGDCYLSLCRSEGWGMGAFDAAAFGKPVIMTGFGGQCEFLPNDLAYLVGYGTEPVRDRWIQKSYSPDQNWAAPDVEHAMRLMREVYENREEARRRGEALGRSVWERFQIDAVAREMLRAIG